MTTCRVCGDHEQHSKKGPLVQYAVRHYAHAECAMTKWGAAFFDRLTPWVAGHVFPVLYAMRAGYLDALKARAAQHKEAA